MRATCPGNGYRNRFSCRALKFGSLSFHCPFTGLGPGGSELGDLLRAVCPSSVPLTTPSQPVCVSLQGSLCCLGLAPGWGALGLLDGVGEDREDAPTPPNPPPSSHRAERVGRWGPLVSPQDPFSAVASLCFSLSPPGFQFSGPGSPRPSAREPGREAGVAAPGAGKGARKKNDRGSPGGPEKAQRRCHPGAPRCRAAGSGSAARKGARGGGRKGAPRCRAAGWEKAGPDPPTPQSGSRSVGCREGRAAPGRGSPGVRGLGRRGPGREASLPGAHRGRRRSGSCPRAQGASWLIPLTTQGG